MKISEIPKSWKRVGQSVWKPVPKRNTNQKMHIKPCLNCKEDFLKEDPRTVFCGTACKGVYFSKSKSPSWKGGKCIMRGYIYLFKPGHPMASRGRDRNYVAEHRFIMAEYIGRNLKLSECVHHINGKTMDNRIENLQILSRSKHSKIHRLQDTKNRKRSKLGRFLKH